MSDGFMNKKRQLLSILLLIILAGLTLFVLLRTTSGLSARQIIDFFGFIPPVYLVLATLCALSCMPMEGNILRRLCRHVGCPAKVRDSIMWASADYYISGLTPLATGGQPAAAYFMQKDGVPLSKATLLLIFNTMEHQGSLLLLGIPSLILVIIVRKRLIPTVAAWLLVYGYVAVSILVIGCILCMKRSRFVFKICRFFINFLSKIHIIKRPEKKIDRLRKSLTEYREASELVGGDLGIILSTLGLNMLLRLLQALPLCFLALGLGFSFSMLPEILSLNILCIIGSGSVPIPGTVGAAELMSMIMLEPVFGDEAAIVILVNRLMVFYLCVIVGGAWTWIRMMGRRRDDCVS